MKRAILAIIVHDMFNGVEIYQGRYVMTTALFKKCYVKAASVNVETSELFNCAAFFWLNLTDKQLAKMSKLLKMQHCKVVIFRGEEWFELKNGNKIKVID